MNNLSAAVCEACGSETVIRFGRRYCKKGVQQTYRCKACGRKFTAGGSFKKIKGDKKLVAEALELYYKGFSLRQIADHFKQFENVDVSHYTVLRWIRHAIKQIDKLVGLLVPAVGDKWHMDETMVKCRKENNNWIWLYNCLDDKTRFLLSSHACEARTEWETRQAIKEAKYYAGTYPHEIITDGMMAYPRAISKYFRRGVTEHSITGLKKGQNNIVERLHGSLKDRTKPMRGFDKLDTASTLLDGWRIWYNFVRKHQALRKTPAEAAGINLFLVQNRWRDLLDISEHEFKKKVRIE